MSWPQSHREGEITLTAFHICHRTRFPFWHVLIERPCSIKHCKSEGAKNKKTQNMRIELRWNSSCRIKKTNTEAWHRDWERLHLLLYILVTAPVFHFDTSWLNIFAFQNTAREGITDREKWRNETRDRIQNKQTEGVDTKKGRDYTYCQA